MPLRLFGAGGNARVRPCPACEQEIKADATFCPSCYMVFRPEGSAALREYLHGARIPADVYLLRKMQSEDPNAGPVTRASGGGAPRTDAEAVPPPAPPAELQSLSPPPSAPPVESLGPPSDQMPAEEPIPLDVPPTDPIPAGKSAPTARPEMKTRNGVEGLLAFREPAPPPTVSAEDAPALFAWMLEKDPFIPNNLDRLARIHASTFENKPAGALTYEQHLLLQVSEDLGLYGTKETLGFHLMQLAAAYRRAGDAYRKAEGIESVASNEALWQMASLASRIRMEAWVYHCLHGEPPQGHSARQRELPLRFRGR